MTRAPKRVALALVLVAAVLAIAWPVAATSSSAPPGSTLRVPADVADLDAAIAASKPGDVILLAPGTYPGGVEVPQDKPGITIRGEDRNTVVFDGGNVRPNAIEVMADGVTLENMTAHGFTLNGFYWDEVEGYAGRYLTVWNVGLYGIYAISSRGGVMEESFVSGAGDAAFYVGECQPCDATIRHVTATLSAVGYSGTNAGGNLVVEDSKFLLNSVGILPNSYDVGLQPPPQRGAVFQRNEVVGSGTVITPRTTPLGGFHGVGIGIAGGQDNVVEDNDVRGSTRYGIAVFTAVDRTQNWYPAGNRITGNHVSMSGIADLALSRGLGGGNCFEGNDITTVLPDDLAGCSGTSDGDGRVSQDLVRALPDLAEGLPSPAPYSAIAAPPAQDTMPNVGAEVGSPFPVDDLGLLAAIVIGLALFAAGVVLVAFRVARRRDTADDPRT